MRKRFSIVGSLLIVLLVAELLFCAACFVPVRGPLRAFRSVQDDPDTWRRVVMGYDPGVEVDGDFAICDGELYLLIQTKRGGFMIVTYVSSRHWDRAEIEALRTAHPELEPLWPDPAQPNAGVSWIE